MANVLVQVSILGVEGVTNLREILKAIAHGVSKYADHEKHHLQFLSEGDVEKLEMELTVLPAPDEATEN